jgi:uncharacterized protein YfdQ (DUF2303 family)
MNQKITSDLDGQADGQHQYLHHLFAAATAAHSSKLGDYLLAPPGWQHIPIEPKPQRQPISKNFATLESFAAYANRYKTDQATITTTWDKANYFVAVSAILNPSSKDKPDFADHLIGLNITPTTEAKAILDHLNITQQHKDFAIHIRAIANQIAPEHQPALVKLISGISVSHKGNYNTTKNHTNGQTTLQIINESTIVDYTIPQTYRVNLAYLQGLEPIPVDIRLDHEVQADGVRFNTYTPNIDLIKAKLAKQLEAHLAALIPGAHIYC